MDKIELESKITQMSDTDFQRLVDYLLREEGYDIISYGNCDGKKRTRKGTPDSYFIDNNKCEMTFVECTTQKAKIEAKIINDIGSCFKKTNLLNKYKLNKILYFVNHNNIPPEAIDSATKLCEDKKVEFKLFSLSYVCETLYKHKNVVYELFKEKIDGANLETLEEFINLTKKQQGIDHSIKYASRVEENEVVSSLNNNFITILSGESGVGKSMLAINVLGEIGGNVYCVSHNNEDALYYFKNNNIVEDKIIIFLDDVNEISSLDEFLLSLNEDVVNKIKIICTVRDYDLNNVINIVKKYKFKYGVINLHPLADNIISNIVKENSLLIKNEDIKKIISVSKGLPRICMMACAVKNNGGQAIFSETKDIYKAFFNIALGSDVKKLIDKNINLLALIAFLRVFDLRHIDNYNEIIDFFNVDNRNLIEDIRELNKFELCSLYESSLVEIKTQGLSDYFIDRVIIDERPFELSQLINKFIGKYANNIHYMVRTIFNVYTSDSSKEYIKREIKECYSYLKCSDNYDIFVKNFYDFDIEEALKYLEKKISEYPLYNDDQSIFSKTYVQNDYVNILCRVFIKYGNERGIYLLGECLDHKNIRNNALDAIIQISSPLFNKKDNILYYNDKIFLLKSFKNKTWFNEVWFEIISNCLKYEYTFYKAISVDKISINSFQINDSIKNARDYRNIVWKEANLLSDEYKYKLIFGFKNFNLKDNLIETFSNDLTNISNLIKSISKESVQYFNEQFFKAIMIANLPKQIDVSALLHIHDESKIEILNKAFELEKKIRFNYTNYKDIILKEDFENLISILIVCKKIDYCFDYFKNCMHELARKIIYSMDKTTSIKLLNRNLMEQLPNDVKGDVLYHNFKMNNKNAVWDYLFSKGIKVNELDEYFDIFKLLATKDINNKVKNEFNECFKLDINIKGDAKRHIKTLYLLCNDDKTFVKKVCKLFMKIQKNTSKVDSWLVELFDINSFAPKKLINMFYNCKKLCFLEKIFMHFACKSGNSYSFALNNYVYELMKYDKKFAEDLISDILFYKNNINVNLLNNLWEQPDCNNIADDIFDIIVKTKQEILYKSYRMEGIYLGPLYRCKDIFLPRATKKISSLTDDYAILLLSAFVLKFDFNESIDYYKKLINLRIDSKLFKEILKCPYSVSYNDSEVKYYNEKLERVKNIRDLIPNKKEYKEYMDVLNEYINHLTDFIKETKINNRLRLYNK